MFFTIWFRHFLKLQKWGIPKPAVSLRVEVSKDGYGGYSLNFNQLREVWNQKLCSD